MQIRLPAPHNGNFSFKKQIQLSSKRTFRAARALCDRLNATERLRAPGDDQAGVAELSFAEQNGLRAFHAVKLAHRGSCRGARRGERRYNMKTLGFAIADLASI